jgi:hypothetical protein
MVCVQSSNGAAQLRPKLACVDVELGCKGQGHALLQQEVPALEESQQAGALQAADNNNDTITTAYDSSNAAAGGARNEGQPDCRRTAGG